MDDDRGGTGTAPPGIAQLERWKLVYNMVGLGGWLGLQVEEVDASGRADTESGARLYSGSEFHF